MLVVMFIGTLWIHYFHDVYSHTTNTNCPCCEPTRYGHTLNTVLIGTLWTNFIHAVKFRTHIVDDAWTHMHAGRCITGTRCLKTHYEDMLSIKFIIFKYKQNYIFYFWRTVSIIILESRRILRS